MRSGVDLAALVFILAQGRVGLRYTREEFLSR